MWPSVIPDHRVAPPAGALTAEPYRRSRPSPRSSLSALESPTDPPTEGQPPGPEPAVPPPDGPTALTVLTPGDHALDGSMSPKVGQVIRPRRRAGRGWERAFLEAFRNSGNVRSACQAARVHRSAPYIKAKRDPQFAANWAAAKDDAVDLLESWLWEAGSKGDTRATIFLLKALRPEVYRDQVEVRFDPRQAAERIATKLGLSVDEVLTAAERLAQELD